MKRLSLAALFSFVLLSCEKESRSSETICFDGEVRWAGDPAADGLGWVLSNADSVWGQTYVPQNLADDFKVANLKIAACVYKTDEKYFCFCAQPLNKYRITSIRRR